MGDRGCAGVTAGQKVSATECGKVNGERRQKPTASMMFERQLQPKKKKQKKTQRWMMAKSIGGRVKAEGGV